MYKYQQPWEYGWLRMGTYSSGGSAVVTHWGPPLSVHFRIVWWAIVIFSALSAIAANAAW